MLLSGTHCPVCGSREDAPNGSIVGVDARTYRLRTCTQCGLRSLVEAPDTAALGEHYVAGYYSQEVLRNPSLLFRLKRHLEQSRSPVAQRIMRSLFIGFLPPACAPG